METKDDISYGVVPVILEDGQWKIFLIHQFTRHGDAYWTFPKGHLEEGESNKQTALRELEEETKIHLKELLEQKEYIQKYTFQTSDFVINKTAGYFLGIAASKEFTIQEDEVKEAGWFSFEDARARLTHDNAKELLAIIASDLQK